MAIEMSTTLRFLDVLVEWEKSAVFIFRTQRGSTLLAGIRKLGSSAEKTGIYLDAACILPVCLKVF